jgi:hypothetical protein
LTLDLLSLALGPLHLLLALVKMLFPQPSSCLHSLPHELLIPVWDVSPVLLSYSISMWQMLIDLFVSLNRLYTFKISAVSSYNLVSAWGEKLDLVSKK